MLAGDTDESLANSTLTPDHDTIESTSTALPESDEDIVAFFQRDYNEKGDGGCSDEEGEEINDHNEAVVLNRDEQVLRDEANDLDVDEEGVKCDNIPGAPNGWIPPGPPDTWTGYIPKFDAPPNFDDVDNPGGWSDFTFRPVYKDRKYVGHFTPSAAKVVPKDKDGHRISNGWTFHYDGWTCDAFDESTFARGDAKKGDLKPESRKGCLDAGLLKKHGLTAERMKRDPLFFLQLLLPICDPSRSGIDNDERIAFFQHARACTNVYALGEKGWGGGTGHKFQNVEEAELVAWYGAVLRHGAREGSPGSLHRRWLKSHPNYDEFIANNMTASRWKQLKSVLKLNVNMTASKRWDPDYDPAAKYDHLYKAMCHNMNYFTRRVESDFAVDKKTWGFCGYCGDAGG